MLKTYARKLVGDAHWEYLSWSRSQFGVFRAIVNYLSLVGNDGIGRAPNHWTGGSVFLRPGTTDQDVYDDIFIEKEYDISLGDPKFIIDAGAHIGLASVFFACRYPNAIIVAIEPEPSNFAVLQMNAKRFPNIHPVQAGLWSRKTHLRIENDNVATWSFRVVESETGNGIPAVGVCDIMDDFKQSRIDVLKIDIEGSEREVLTHSAAWIDDVQTMIIELHDRFQPGCTEALALAVADHNYRNSASGESIVIADLSRKPVAASRQMETALPFASE